MFFFFVFCWGAFSGYIFLIIIIILVKECECEMTCSQRPTEAAHWRIGEEERERREGKGGGD